jgi:hypothetical protein
MRDRNTEILVYRKEFNPNCILTKWIKLRWPITWLNFKIFVCPLCESVDWIFGEQRSLAVWAVTSLVTHHSFKSEESSHINSFVFTFQPGLSDMKSTK